MESYTFACQDDPIRIRTSDLFLDVGLFLGTAIGILGLASPDAGLRWFLHVPTSQVGLPLWYAADMNLLVRPADESDAVFAYTVKRAALGKYVAQVWGWDESVQQAYHASDWAKHRPDLVALDDVLIGTLEVVQHADHVYIGEFYLLPEYQRRGIGTELLRRVLAKADAAGLPARLQFLKVNPVRSLYERHGFQITAESTTHYFAERSPGRPPRA